MFLLLYIGIIIIAYIITFKNDFTPEHLEKAGPFIIIPSVLLIILGILGSLMAR